MNSEEQVPRVIWDGNVAHIPVFRRLQGLVTNSLRPIDFAAVGVERHGLLEESLVAGALPLHHSVFNQLRRMLQELKGTPTLNVLSKKTEVLSREDITALFRGIEDAIEASPGISTGSRNSVSAERRRVFTQSPKSLASGDKVSALRFTSRFPSHMGTIGRELAAQAKNKKSLINEGMLIASEHSDEESLRNGVLEAMSTDLARIETACWNTIELYIATRDEHRRLLRQYKDAATPKTFPWQLHPERAMGLKLAELERQGAFSAKGMRRLIEATSPKSFIDAFSLPDELRLSALNSPFRTRWGFKIGWHEIFSCSYFMPRVVMEAAEILMVIKTCWNVGPVAALTSDNFVQRNGYYQIEGVKTKTGDALSIKIHRANDKNYYDLVTLLLEHNACVKSRVDTSDDTIWATWRKVKSVGTFGRSTSGEENKRIAVPWGLPRFSKKQLRDQVANIEWLRSMDPYHVRELLGHRSLAVTAVYLHQNVVRILSRANIKRFMDQLAATIVWTVFGEASVESKELKLADVNRRLLFPPPGRRDAKSKADEWIASCGTERIEIGMAEINHVKWQIKYYKDHADRLRQENPKGFLMFDLPRILFASALAQLLRESEYSSLLND